MYCGRVCAEDFAKAPLQRIALPLNLLNPDAYKASIESSNESPPRHRVKLFIINNLSAIKLSRFSGYFRTNLPLENFSPRSSSPLESLFSLVSESGGIFGSSFHMPTVDVKSLRCLNFQRHSK